MKRVRKQTKAASKKRKPTQKQTPKTTESAADYREPVVTMRFGATIHPTRAADPKSMDQLDIDRLPDTKGEIRALVTAADCVRLLNKGFEVRLVQAYPVKPLDPSLIENDEKFGRELEKRVKAIKRPPNRKG